MSETVEIFGKPYKTYEMTYAEQAIAWKNSAPTADITIGRFTLTYRYESERGWGTGWICWNSEWSDESPEYEYFQDLIARNDTSWHEVHFIDTILEAMKVTPYIPDPDNIFLQGESK